MNSENADGENRLSDLSIAPDSGTPQSTRDKTLEWTAGEHHDNLVIELAAVDDEGIYTAVSKGTFSREQAKKLRDDIDHMLDSE